jgi:hypothetical protein
MKTTPEIIAQWVIDNRYPKSENEKVPDIEMYNYIVEEIYKIEKMWDDALTREINVR